MKRSVVGLLAVTALAAPVGSRVWAQTRVPWIHVRVEEPRNDSKVSVNLPLSVAQAALNLAPEKVLSDGRMHLGHAGKGLSATDMRRMWGELRASGDAEIVSVEDKNETVKIARLGDRIRIRVESPERNESVSIEMPVGAVDALLSGEGESLNLRAAFGELQKLRGEVVKVDDKDTKVRIWIDEGN